MKKVGILYHPKIKGASELAGELERLLYSMNVSVWICSAWDEEEAKARMNGTELILSLGGDGTILRSARVLVLWQVPIVGVKLGKLGFMSELSADQAVEKLPVLLAGEGWIDERAMVEAELIPIQKGYNQQWHALNDIVIARGAASRVIHIRAQVDGEFLTIYKADGLITATATGSTGYCLAAGGPILHPRAKELILQPISAHLSFAATLVLPPDVTLELQVQTDHQAMLSIDGQVNIELANGDRVRARRSPHVTRFLRIHPPADYYKTLAHKLGGRQEWFLNEEQIESRKSQGR